MPPPPHLSFRVPRTVRRHATQYRYHGEMKQGKPHGMGTKTWPDESEYVGEFSSGKEVRLRWKSGGHEQQEAPLRARLVHDR